MRRNLVSYIVLFVLLVVFFAADVVLGDVLIPFKYVAEALKGGNTDGAVWNIIFNYRLPKALTAVLCGAALSLSGLLMQTLFRNPLAGPYVLGISSGAGLGVAILVLSAGLIAVPSAFVMSGWAQVVAAVVGAAFVMALVLLASLKVRDTVSLLIVGIMFGGIAGAVVNVLQSISNPDALKIYVVWTMGSLSAVTWQYLTVMAPVVLGSIVIALFLPKSLNALLLGENYATGLGVNVGFTRVVIIVLTCLLAGASTAFTGPIAFIGVAVPHIVRGVFKTADHRVVLPASVLAGAVLLLVCDIVSCLPGTIYTIPVNSISALVGAPIILWVIIKNKHLNY